MQDNQWPIPRFYFIVNLVSHDLMGYFQEVSGLETDKPVWAFETENEEAMRTFKFHKIPQLGSIIFKKGIFDKSNQFLKWYNIFNKNIIQTEKLTIQLVNEKR